MIVTGEQVDRDLEERCQVLVIGSGAGGSAIASELAEAGLDVVILEEGGYYTSRDFNSDPAQMIPKLYRDAGTAVIVGSPSIIFSEGCCVGGSTVINGGMCWRTSEKVLNRWQTEFGLSGITAKTMEPFYEKVEKIINVAPQTPESLSKAEMLIHRAATRLGYLIRRDRRNQLNCTGEGLCVFGCPTDRKRSVLVTYIPKALAAGARLYADCRAVKITARDGKATGAVAHIIDRKTKKKKHTLKISAQLVIAAGGAIQTPSLLFASRLGNAFKQVGKNFLCHPNVKVVGIFDEEIRYWAGVHQGHQIHEFLDEGMIFALGGVHPALVSMSMPGYGRRSLELMELWNHMIVAGALIDDTTYGHVSRMFWGAAMAFYQIDDVEYERMLRAVGLMSEIMFTAGARKVLLPFFQLQEINGIDEIKKISDYKIRKAEIETLTVHAFGTSRMCASPEQGVVDQWGKVHGTERLFVIDSGIIPTSLGVNPQETIMALATRSGQYILENKSKFLAGA